MEEIKNLLIYEFGTIDALSSRLRIKSQAVYNWFSRGRIPLKHLKEICYLSDGRLTKEMLRPDLFGENNGN